MKKLVQILLAFFAFVLAADACAGYPDKPIQLIIPFAAGGSVDVIGRVLAQSLTQDMGEQVIVQNRPGAGGTLGAEIVARSSPDGYTLLMSTLANQSFQPLLYKHLPYDANKDFAPVATVASIPNVLVVSNKVPAKTVQDLVAYAKANPKKLFMGSAGNGSVNQMVGELFQYKTGAQFQHVPYKGAEPASTDLVAGQIDLMFVNVPTVLPFIKAGQMRPLVVLGEKRSDMLPDVPTTAQAGIADCVVDSWFGVLAPAGTPPAVVQKLSAQIGKVLQDKTTVAKLAALGAAPLPGGSAEYEARNRFELRRWSEVIKRANITIN